MTLNSTNLDYYSILDVSRESLPKDIQGAYLTAKKTFSLSNPEIYKIFTQKEAIEWLNLIEEAYSIIGDRGLRKTYDNQFGESWKTENLPSFDLEPKSENTTTTVLAETCQEVPLGFGMTAFGIYPIDEGFEEIIKDTDLFTGGFLQEIRRYKKIDLEELSNKSCIALRYLYAIENDNYDALPAAVFVRGYIIQYTKALELDEKIPVDSFMSLYTNA